MYVIRTLTVFISVLCFLSPASAIGDTARLGTDFVADSGIVREEIRSRIDQLQSQAGLMVQGEEISSRQVVPALYDKFDFRPIWTNDQSVDQFLEVLQTIDEDGLDCVQNGGTVTVTPLKTPAPPANFRFVTGTAYEITTDMTVEWPATVCLGYEDTALAKAGNELNLRLFHRSNNNWEDITDSVHLDNNRICGVTYSFSPFAVGEPEESEAIAPAPTTSTGLPVMNGWWLLAAIAGGAALLRRRSK